MSLMRIDIYMLMGLLEYLRVSDRSKSFAWCGIPSNEVNRSQAPRRKLLLDETSVQYHSAHLSFSTSQPVLWSQRFQPINGISAKMYRKDHRTEIHFRRST